MPKQTRKISRRRTTRKVRRGMGVGGAQRTTLVNTALRPIPSRFITKLKYSQTFSVSGSVTAPQQFNLNSIFDPDRTGVGTQPYGYDQLATLYNRYRVISCNYAISGYNGTFPIRVAAFPSNNATAVGTVSEAIMQPRCKFIHQNPGGSQKVLKGKVYIPALMGRNKSQYMADDDYQAQIAANPNELAILSVYSAGTLDGPLTGTSLTVVLTFLVELFDPTQLPAS